jgi:hypothetical protein
MVIAVSNLALTGDPEIGSPEGAVKRLTGLDADALEPLRASAALAEGKVNLIGLDGVVGALGERWQGRREQIYDHVEKVIERQLGPSGYMLRISETDYLVAQPDLGPFGAQASSLRMLREVLEHFLGAVSPASLKVCRVTDLDGSEIMAAPIDPRSAVEGEAHEEKIARAAAQAAANADLLSQDRWSPFVAGNGRHVRVSCALEPVFELKGNTRIGFRLNRRLIDTASEEPVPHEEVQYLSRADLLRMDMATIARGVTRLRSDPEGGKALSLIIPVSYVSLSTAEGRKALSAAFDQARKEVSHGVICEVCDIEDVPQATLLSAISLIRPSTLLIIGHLFGDRPRAASGLKEAGLQAISVTCPQNIQGDAEFLGWARDTMKTVRKVSRSVIIYGCDSPRRLAMAGLMEASHASLKTR